LAADPSGTWLRLLTDPDTGRLLDYGRTRYRPPQDLTDFVLARDPICFFPGCHQPGYLCDLDHSTPWEAGGATCPGNTRPGCRRHHNCKTHTAWSYRVTDHGAITWTSPTGHTYTSRPPDRWTTPTEQPPRDEQVLKASRESEQERHARDDQAYTALTTRLRIERTRAHKASDHHAEEQANQALTEAHLWRQRQLRHRADPNYPPF
jgi:hypothetical protein